MIIHVHCFLSEMAQVVGKTPGLYSSHLHDVAGELIF
jgi:hypothetical protein